MKQLRNVIMLPTNEASRLYTTSYGSDYKIDFHLIKQESMMLYRVRPCGNLFTTKITIMSDKKEFTFKNIDLAIKWMNHYFPDSKSIEFEEKVKELHKISGVTIFLLSDELNFIINNPIPNYIYCDKPSYVKER